MAQGPAWDRYVGRPSRKLRRAPLKIEHNTPDLLIVGEIPWFVGIATLIFIMAFVTPGVLLLAMGDWVGVVVALLGAGLGLGAMAMFAERLQVIMDVSRQIVTIRSRTIVRHRQTVFPLKDVLQATRETSLSSSVADPSKPSDKIGRPSLILDDGSGQGRILHPITETYSNSGGAEVLIEAINDWLDARRMGTEC